jgi:hypothetical protein
MACGAKLLVPVQEYTLIGYTALPWIEIKFQFVRTLNSLSYGDQEVWKAIFFSSSSFSSSSY